MHFFFFGQVLLRKQLHTAMATGHALALQHASRQTTLCQPAGRVAGTCQFLFQLGLLFSFELGTQQSSSHTPIPAKALTPLREARFTPTAF